MSKPVFSDLFTFSGRRNRKSYVLFHLSAVAVLVVGAVICGALGFVSAGASVAAWTLYVVASLVLGVSCFAVSAQRIRDFGYSGCWVFLYLIPYIGFAASIAIYFVPSNPGDNKYGPTCI